MGKRLFYFEVAGTTHRIKLQWKEHWCDITIDLDGKNIGEFYKKDFLLKGYDWSLDTETTLCFKLIPRFKTYDLQVTCNSDQIVQLLTDPEDIIKVSYSAVFTIAFLNLIIGIRSVIFPVNSFKGGNFSIGFLFFGYLLAILGIFIRKKSIVALIISIGVWLLDTIFFLVASALSENEFKWALLFFSIYCLAYLFEALKVIKVLKMKIYQAQ